MALAVHAMRGARRSIAPRSGSSREARPLVELHRAAAGARAPTRLREPCFGRRARLAEPVDVAIALGRRAMVSGGRPARGAQSPRSSQAAELRSSSALSIASSVAAASFAIVK
jgi:hypothetical protein